MTLRRAYSGCVLFIVALSIPSTGSAQPLATIIESAQPGYDMTVTTNGHKTNCAELSGDPHQQMRLESFVGATASASWTLRCVDVTVSYEFFVTVTSLGLSSAPNIVDWHTHISMAYDSGESDLTVYDQSFEASLYDGDAFGAGLRARDLQSYPRVRFSEFREYNHVTYSP